MSKFATPLFIRLSKLKLDSSNNPLKDHYYVLSLLGITGLLKKLQTSNSLLR